MNKHDNFNNNIFFYDTFVGGTLILLAQSLKINRFWDNNYFTIEN